MTMRRSVIAAQLRGHLHSKQSRTNRIIGYYYWDSVFSFTSFVNMFTLLVCKVVDTWHKEMVEIDYLKIFYEVLL